jgi:chromosome segregation ATPase
LTEQQVKVGQLSQELETLKIEHTAAVSKAEELERILKSTKDAHDATQVFAAGGLAEILNAHKERSLKNASRSIDGSGDADEEGETSVHLPRLRALEEEMGSVKQLHADTRSKSDSLAAELSQARSREAQLHAQVASLRQEISTLQSQQSNALEDLGKHKSLVSEREAEAKEATRTKQASDVKVGILRNLMADHGLAVNDEDLATRYPPMNGSETPEQLYQRVQELEARLEQKTKAHSDLDSNHQDARKELEDLTRQRDEHVEELQRLRENPIADPEEKSRLLEVQGELESLQQRHSQLEATHLKAVQYVKGTEKMLRRMKEVSSIV